MNNTAIGGAMLRDMLLTGTVLLEKNKAHIDSLNVFPVPDGDTGTNMYMTMQSAAHELKALKSERISDVAAAAALGSLKGARGNSGVILSQIFRGFSRALTGLEEMDGAAFAQALKMGTDAAYKAVMKPREGTMLTVARRMSEAVEEASAEGANVYKLIDVMLESGDTALRLTPTLLPVLREAGVVDSGGKGLLTIFRGFKMVIDGEEAEDYVDDLAGSAAEAEAETAADFDGLGEIEFGYCSEFFITHLDESFTEGDLDKLREKLNKIGDSVVVAYDGGIVKVHAHSNCPGKILQLALRLGEVDKVKIDNMREQNRAVLENLKKNEKETAMIAVSAGPGLDRVFEGLGCAAIISGGQTMNPSTEAIGRAIRKANARNVIVLPNNSNIILAARQAAEISERSVLVIPTKTMMQGVAAAVAFSDDVPAETAVKHMDEAASAVVSGSVTYAVRDTRVNGAEIKKGDVMGLIDGDIVEIGSDVDAVAEQLMERMLREKAPDSVVTVFYGAESDAARTDALIEKAQLAFPEAEFTAEEGGQPLYYYLISVE